MAIRLATQLEKQHQIYEINGRIKELRFRAQVEHYRWLYQQELINQELDKLIKILNKFYD